MFNVKPGNTPVKCPVYIALPPELTTPPSPTSVKVGDVLIYSTEYSGANPGTAHIKFVPETIDAAIGAVVASAAMIDISIT